VTTPARMDTDRPGLAREREAELAPIRVGTRGSALALWQTHYVLDRLRERAPGVDIAVQEITTRGDRTQALAVPLTQLGDKSMFVAELERALLAAEIDLAVHSLKDLPGRLDPGLAIAATPKRADPCDALVSRSARRLADLPEGAVVATSSLRRRAQLLHLRPDLRIVEMRGNVDTRLRKALAPDGPDATVLAVAGLERLGLADRMTERLPADVLVPAVGQGALAVEIRADDGRMRRLLRQIDHKRTRLAVTAERAVLAALGGGCQVPLGACATVSADGETIRLIAVVAGPDGARLIRVEREGSARRPAALGREVARELLRQGGSEILRAILNR
jgi:hydroxymethylbilane synthase